MMQPYSSARPHSAGNAPRSPSMLNTPSVMRSLRAVRGQVADNGARRIHITVRKNLDRRAAQTRPVDDAGVIELVGNDDVLLGEDRGDGARVCGEATLKYDRSFRFLEFGQPSLELHMNRHRAGDGADRSGSDAPPLERVECLLLEPRVCRQAQIVVGRQIDDVAAVDGCPGRLRIVQDAQLTVQPLRLQRRQLIAEER